ncbi:MAG: hypothetical protein JW755_11840 [Candidatus Aminicenantes bacterium]|nr:hypothetical protein [Candidatus Aminicenantes bacterium]
METANLLVICLVAIFWVFIILTFLAFLMRLIILVFPEKRGKTDGAVISAITAAAFSVFPGMRITKIEEKK